MIFIVIWTVLMMFWLFGVGGYVAYKHPEDRSLMVGSVLIPWVCVLILGLVVFGAISVSPGVVVYK